MAPPATVRLVLPAHLRTLAGVDAGDVLVDVEGAVTLGSVLDALEHRHPKLRGTIRDHVTLRRRAFIRFFACEEDLSHEPPDTPLPDAVAAGNEPLYVVGAIAGGVALSSEATQPKPSRQRRRGTGRGGAAPATFE